MTVAHNFIEILHYLIVLFIISIPFHPIVLLRITVYIPLFLFTIWLMFNGCPLTNVNKKDKNDLDFIHKTMRVCFTTISAKTVDNIVNYFLVVVIYIGFIRLRMYDNKQQQEEIDSLNNKLNDIKLILE